ncbi:hypothetical protein J3F83DRAFT_306408 [Trichoderma novae-zelandiae]
MATEVSNEADARRRPSEEWERRDKEEMEEKKEKKMEAAKQKQKRKARGVSERDREPSQTSAGVQDPVVGLGIGRDSCCKLGVTRMGEGVTNTSRLDKTGQPRYLVRVRHEVVATL